MAMNLRLSDDEQALLDGLAAETGLSKNDIMRRALVELAQREGHAARVEGSADWALTRYADLLDRLGSA